MSAKDREVNAQYIQDSIFQSKPEQTKGGTAETFPTPHENKVISKACPSLPRHDPRWGENRGSQRES